MLGQPGPERRSEPRPVETIALRRLGAIIGVMRQLIARVDDDLHARLKARARAEGRSLNSLVTEVLAAAVERDDKRARLRARLKADGLLVEVPMPTDVPSEEEAAAIWRRLGHAVIEALEADRAAR